MKIAQLLLCLSASRLSIQGGAEVTDRAPRQAVHRLSAFVTLGMCGMGEATTNKLHLVSTFILCIHAAVEAKCIDERQSLTVHK